MNIKKIFQICLLTMCLIVNCAFIPTAQIKFYCDTSYFETGDGDYTYHNEIINFDTEEITDYHLERLCPIYRNISQENSCAPLAGSIIIGYYDYEFENLIANFTAGYYYNNKFYYRSQNTTVISMKEELYALMGTNTVQPGTSVSQFKTGLTSYVNLKSLNIQYSRCNSINDMNNYFQLQQPIVLFLNSYDYYDEAGMSRTDNQLCLYGKISTNGHVVVAYGYKQYKFYTNNVLTRTENFLVVAFGDGSTGFLSVNSLNCIDEAYAIKIY